MIVPDTSVWIDFIRGSRDPRALIISDQIRAGAILGVPEPVLMEVLAGARSTAQVEDLRSLLLSHEVLPVDGLSDYEDAAAIYRACRTAGETVRKLIDCIIAVCVIRQGAELLHNDADFDKIARHSPLRIYSPA